MGDSVWQHDPVGTRGIPRKFKKYWTGPFIVTRQLNQVVFEIEDAYGKTQTCHIDRLKQLKPYVDETEGEELIPDSIDVLTFEPLYVDESDGTVPLEIETERTTRCGRKVRTPQRYSP